MNFTYEMLADVIKEKMGIDFKQKIDYLKRKVEPKLKKENKTIAEMITKINRDPKYLQELIELVTINETYFYREKEQLEAYKKTLSEFKGKKKKLKIWSCACSTGEEPYTLAFIAKKVLGDETDFEIIATDIDNKVIDVAKEGKYQKSSLSFRRMNDRQKEEYFDEANDYLEVKKTYKEKITFKNFNLVDKRDWFRMKDFDIIFCRNVLIYFDDETVKEINENFYNSIKEGGYLFLGHADPHRDIYPKFEIINTIETTYMKKEG